MPVTSGLTPRGVQNLNAVSFRRANRQVFHPELFNFVRVLYASVQNTDWTDSNLFST